FFVSYHIASGYICGCQPRCFNQTRKKREKVQKQCGLETSQEKKGLRIAPYGAICGQNSYAMKTD
ncbi:MAG: hypothetical protein LBT00_11775, partial [Spirochaetaceae bacterium]|nr:hypothetical protein [Spirochaetaceae bacterium]